MKSSDMQNIKNQDLEQRSVHSTSNCENTRSSGWNSSTSYYPPYYLKNMNLNLNSLAEHANQLKHLGNQIGDQDSSSTQSTGQSLQEVSGSSEGNLQEQCILTQSGNDNVYAKHVERHMKSALTLGSPEASFMPPSLDYNPSVACMPCAYDPYYGTVLAPYGSHAIIHPQMIGMTPSRVPLPHEEAEEEPIYVNAKQYHAILRRRELRAKQEAQNKLIKGRKPYLHESRHIHAMKRARGVGGRFLNTKKLQEQAESQENGSTATPTSSEVTRVSNGDGGCNLGFHHQDHFGFSAGQTGGRVPVMR